MSGNLFSNTSLKILVRDSKQPLPPALNISITTPVGPLYFPLFALQLQSCLYLLEFNQSLILDLRPLHVQHNILTYSPHLSAFPRDFSKCSYVHPQSRSLSPSHSSSNLHLKQNAPILCPLLCNSEQPTIITIDCSLLNRFRRCLLHCSSCKSLSNLFCVAVLTSIPLITNSFPDLKQFPLPIYSNINIILLPSF